MNPCCGVRFSDHGRFDITIPDRASPFHDGASACRAHGIASLRAPVAKFCTLEDCPDWRGSCRDLARAVLPGRSRVGLCFSCAALVGILFAPRATRSAPVCWTGRPPDTGRVEHGVRAVFSVDRRHLVGGFAFGTRFPGIRGADRIPHGLPSSLRRICVAPGRWLVERSVSTRLAEWAATGAVIGVPLVAVGIEISRSGSTLFELVAAWFLCLVTWLLAVVSLLFQFEGDVAPPCLDAVDADDNGRIDTTDPLAVLIYLFRPVLPLPAPGAGICGIDESSDGLGCLVSVCSR